MIIVGADLSPTSPGFVKFFLDDDFNITKAEKLGFISYDSTKKKVVIPSYKDIVSYDSELDFYNRSFMFLEYIKPFLDDVDYIAIEDYAMHGMGMVFQIAEFCSLIKYEALKRNIKIRLYTPTQVKQFGSGKGSNHKPEMYESFVEKGYNKIIDISDLPKIPIYSRGKFVGLPHPSGISPLSDAIDGFFLGDLLRKELMIRYKKIELKDLEKIEQHVLTHTTKNIKLSLIEQSFVEVNK